LAGKWGQFGEAISLLTAWEQKDIFWLAVIIPAVAWNEK
jgi:hypothetical protein